MAGYTPRTKIYPFKSTPLLKYPYKSYFKSKTIFVLSSKNKENKVVIRILIPEIRFGINIATRLKIITVMMRNSTFYNPYLHRIALVILPHYWD